MSELREKEPTRDMVWCWTTREMERRGGGMDETAAVEPEFKRVAA